MSDLPDTVELLKGRVEALEQRVAALEPRVDTLEHPLAARWPHPSPEMPGASPAQAAGEGALAPSGSIFQVLGMAMLGVAGAYLLRAIEEASSLPKLAVAAAGIAYAFLWLVWSARTRTKSRFASSIYAGTSALILAPMLWELALRFSVLSAATAAGVVCAYAITAVGLTWNGDRAPVLRVAGIASAGLAMALALASHALMPFIVALLILAAICEFAPGPARMPEIRALVALAADALIWILIYIYFAPQSAGENLPALSRAALLAPGIALFVVFAASVCWKTARCAKPITAFETVQMTIAFVLAAVSVADFGPMRSVAILGVVCLVLSATVYAAVFTIFGRAKERRNSAVFAAWGAALLLAGSFLCLSPSLAAILPGAAATAAMIVARLRSRLVPELYGMVFLLAAASASGLLSFVVSALVGTPPGLPSESVWLIACAAILCYAAAKPGEREAWKPQVLHLGFAVLAAGSVAALLVRGLVALTGLLVQLGAYHLAFIRTLTLCMAALALVYGGAHRQRVELTRLGYTVLALVAVKLVTEDLRHGHLGYIAASVFLVALTLIAAPRMARARQNS